MVNVPTTRSRLSERDVRPDLFHAAEVDDVPELLAGLSIGLSLNSQAGALAMTPMHIAAINSSNNFIKVACKNAIFDPWIRDQNLRTAFDHASAFGNVIAKDYLFDVMYHATRYDFSKLQL